ncbi:hypothetical protein J1N35_013893 [Gossypium stocksii]|uniref:Uncharacterized protein n=1 Tax=Gossypium stocksii TaxID=47602 RepID=A0A9D3VTG6_9ROSI|nr:hypothetical protein J1N35_013893 [Gossypium stocksii]
MFIGYAESIASIIEKHGGQVFCVHPDDVLTKVVREFYAPLMSLNNSFIYVRGTLVLLDAYSINAQYALLDEQDEHTQFTITVTIAGLTQVLQNLYIEGTKWKVSRQDCYTMERTLLKPNY